MSQHFPEADLWKLTLYEQNRKPQEIVTDDTEIAISPKNLHNELLCPICLDILQCTMATKECLHRFCQECITTALRSGNKECPTCRKKLVSKRSLRFDPNFDALIAKIYPKRDEFEAHEEKILANLTKQSSALQHSIEEGMRRQAQFRKRKNHNLPDCDAMSDTNSETNGSTSGIGRSKKRETSLPSEGQDYKSKSVSVSDNEDHESEANNEKIEFILYPLKSEEEKLDEQFFHERYLKTSKKATVAHICKYLQTRLPLESASNPTDISDISLSSYEFGFSLSSSKEAVDRSKRLDVIAEECESSSPFKLYYWFQSGLSDA